MARKKKERQTTEFDLTPMIDVTFQLLIFFMVTMKIDQKEHREVADLSQKDGVKQIDDAPQDFLVLRMFWLHDEMTYEFNVNHGNNMGRGPSAVQGGTLTSLLNDRDVGGHPHYAKVFGDLLNRMNEMAARIPHAGKLELAMSFDSTRSSRDQIERTAPWGYVTLALDVATQFNINRKRDGQEPYKITFKNTEPAGTPVPR